MPTILTRSLRSIAPAIAAALMFTAAATAVAGPPWISIEYPPSPYDRVTRTAYLLVHSYHHFTPVGLPVSGTAEGIVKGERKSIKLDFEATSRDGVFALRKQWPDAGTWTLVISVTQGQGEFNTVTAVVDIGANGQVAAVEVPTRQAQGNEERGWTYPKSVKIGDIDAQLRKRASLMASRNE